jgi:NAD(P)-dependent dehydrogenase (short-subunit alcohol dehydrogenase family)
MAVLLARQGARVAVTGRRQAKLEETARLVKDSGAADCVALLGGVVDPAEVKAHYAEIKSRWGGLDWAVLNAGVGDSNNAREFSAENVKWTFETNVFGVANWMEAVIPDMLAARSGVIAGISSIAGFRGLPGSGSYSASKAALNSLLESSRVDLRGTGVDVVTVCPGFVKSEMTARNDPKEMWFLLEAEDGAQRIIDGIAARRRVVHFPWQLSVPMIYGVHNLPGFLYDRLSSMIRRKKKKYVDESKAAGG